MSNSKLVAALGEIDEMWGAALKEKGFEFRKLDRGDEIDSCKADFLIIDARSGTKVESIEKLRSKTASPIISLIEDSISKDDLKSLTSKGTNGYLSALTPPEEVALRIQSMSQPKSDARTGESRSSRRVWFQQQVEFRIFDKSQKAWSTTLSETGIFLRTQLSFPLYSVMHLKFSVWGETEPFECDGVIVRQEVDEAVKGLGVMFQNLKGENVRRLESFFEAYS